MASLLGPESVEPESRIMAVGREKDVWWAREVVNSNSSKPYPHMPTGVATRHKGFNSSDDVGDAIIVSFLLDYRSVLLLDSGWILIGSLRMSYSIGFLKTQKSFWVLRKDLWDLIYEIPRTTDRQVQRPNLRTLQPIINLCGFAKAPEFRTGSEIRESATYKVKLVITFR